MFSWTGDCCTALRVWDLQSTIHVSLIGRSSSSPFFLVDRFLSELSNLMNWQAAVEKTVTGLGYELVDVERGARGLLRVFIDRVPGHDYASGAGEFITVDDCEQVTRQLQYVLEVEGAAYERLEVSSPGLDRPLKRESDYRRFVGSEIDLTLKMPLAGRKKFRGLLVERAGEGWRLEFHDGKADQALDFTLDEVREAQLVPVIDFKGRRGRPTEAGAAHDADRGPDDKKVDGGRTQ